MNKNHFTRGRMNLYEQVPLEQPTTIVIWASTACNFKCYYCMHSLSDEQLASAGFKKEIMPYEIFEKVVNSAVSDGWHLKKLLFAGLGEPLLNKDIAKMVAYAKRKSIAKVIEINTNAALLTEDMSNRLIEAGLDQLRVSVQGITNDSYWKIANIHMDIKNYVQQLKFFYEHKKATRVYVKTVDTAITEDERPGFEEMFNGVSDVVAIENVVPVFDEINYGDLSGSNMFGEDLAGSNINVCPRPFHQLSIYPNGDTGPCCSITDMSFSFGNICNQSLSEIWGSSVRSCFLLKQLEGYKRIPICHHCNLPSCALMQGDVLDGHEEEIEKKISEKMRTVC